MDTTEDPEAGLAAKRVERLELATQARMVVREAHMVLNAAPAALQAQAQAALDEALDAYVEALDLTGEAWRRGAMDPPEAGAANPLDRMLGLDEDEGKVPV